MLKGTDIASYQSGMDCSKIEADFVIVKATQGTSYTNPYFAKHYSQAVAAGKLVGAYHYASGGDANAEADFFLRIVGHRAGDCVLCLDWEHNRPGGENTYYHATTYDIAAFIALNVGLIGLYHFAGRALSEKDPLTRRTC